MINNHVLRSLRHTISASDGDLVDIFGLGGVKLNRDTLWSFTKKEEEEGFVILSDALLSSFLDGLIEKRRGKNPNPPKNPPPVVKTNNDVLKKIRVAFNLTDADMMELLRSVGLNLSKHEINAFFRNPDHKNFKLCGDQVLRNILNALAKKIRPE